jgi:hypothetical protein
MFKGGGVRFVVPLVLSRMWQSFSFASIAKDQCTHQQLGTLF